MTILISQISKVCVPLTPQYYYPRYQYSRLAHCQYSSPTQISCCPYASSFSTDRTISNLLQKHITSGSAPSLSKCPSPSLEWVSLEKSFIGFYKKKILQITQKGRQNESSLHPIMQQLLSVLFVYFLPTFFIFILSADLEPVLSVLEYSRGTLDIGPTALKHVFVIDITLSFLQLS